MAEGKTGRNRYAGAEIEAGCVPGAVLIVYTDVDKVHGHVSWPRGLESEVGVSCDVDERAGHLEDEVVDLVDDGDWHDGSLTAYKVIQLKRHTEHTRAESERHTVVGTFVFEVEEQIWKKCYMLDCISKQSTFSRCHVLNIQ